MPYITERNDTLVCYECRMEFDKGDVLLDYDGEVLCGSECFTNYVLDTIGSGLEEVTPEELDIGVTWVEPMVEEVPLKGQTSL